MEIECVTLIYGVEKSFAKLNAIIQQYDLEIVTPSLTEIEAKYSKIFSGSVEYTITAQIVNLGISLEFNNLLQSNRFGVYFSTINDTPILFIKSKSKKYNGGLLGLANAFESIIIQLFTVLRIYKHGDFDILGFFVLDSNRRTLVYDSIRPTSRHFGWEGYSLNNQDVKNLSAEFRKSFKFLKDQHAIGYDILLSSYREDNINLRFIMVIIGLESMLIESSSRGRKGSIIARGVVHILKARDRTIVSEVESEIIGLYRDRNKIVHSGIRASNMQHKVKKVTSFLREVLQYVFNEQLTKDELIEEISQDSN